MNRTVHRRNPARVDILHHFLYIGENNYKAGKRFLRAFNSACQLLARMPGMGTVRDFQAVDLADLKSWPIKGFENFLIFYVPTPTGIDVVRVIHGARDLQKIFQQP